MFTGIVAEVGRIARIQPLSGGGLRMAITAATVLQQVAPGDSVAVNGVCLTVADLSAPTFTADVMAETLRRTTLGTLAPGAAVNLETAATPATALGGHIVQGHVDGRGTIRSRRPDGGFDEVAISLPAQVARYVVEKGSITVEGVSLTVASVGADDQGDWFRVALIPATLQHTTLGGLAEGASVNLEVDVIAKYVERLLGQVAQ
jgi:riboflavin synthase